MTERIKAFIKAAGKALAPYKKNIIIPLLEIIGIIVICALIVHFISGHETLKQYAAKNPDIAYQASADVSASDNASDETP